MTIQEVTSIPIRCRFGDLAVVVTGSEGESSSPILHAEEPFTLQTMVEFLDSSAAALLALKPVIQVEFYAKSCGPGENVSLGETEVGAIADQRTYAPSLSLGPPVELGFTADGVYRLGALLQVGAAAGPALICAVQEDGLVQIHSPKPEAAKNGRKKAGRATRL